MNTLRRLIAWLDANREVGLDLLRVYLGVGLFVRGVLFIADSMAYADVLLADARPTLLSAAVLHYIAPVHLVGGLMLALGLLTRLAALAQVPILVGAVLLVHWQEGLLSANQSLELSAFVLFALVVFTLFGAGRWSLDHYLFRRSDEAPEPGRSERAAAILRQLRAEEEARRAAYRPPAVRPRPAELLHENSDLDVEVRYSLLGLFYFLAGITAPPREVVFRSKATGAVVSRSRDPEVL
ncbi:MAG: DoxX family protein, partial [Bacteroidetes bacterium]